MSGSRVVDAMVDHDASIQLVDADGNGHSMLGGILGPQRLGVTIGEELELFGVQGRVAAITAGWQEAEAEDDELDDAVGHRAINLRLHGRCEALFARDRELALAHREKQDRLRRLQTLHRVRLDYSVEPLRELLGRDEPEHIIGPEIESAFDLLRALDTHHLARIRDVQEAFEHDLALSERESVASERASIAEVIDRCAAVAIAGGHVASLLNRLVLFGLAEQIRNLPVFAWSAGAMCLTDRVVLFHDHPPQGRGNAEILAPGLGLLPGIVVMPHARQRLMLMDPIRVTLLARRFAPARSIAFDEHCGLRFRADGTSALPGTRELLPSGETVDLGAPAPRRRRKTKRSGR